MYNTVCNTTIQSNFELNDHSLVLVKIMANNLPHIGEGMWKLKDTTIDNKKFKEKTKQMLIEYRLWVENYLKEETNTEGNNQIMKS